MKRLLLVLSLTFGLLCWTAAALLAQDPNINSAQRGLPVVPISVEFRHLSQFFRQNLGQGSKYSSITGFVDNTRNPVWYEIILRERASSVQVYYSNSTATVAAFINQGDEAYDSEISYQASGDPSSNPGFLLQFQDRSREKIRWSFRAGPRVNAPSSKPEFLDRPDDHGLVLLRFNQSRKASSGTVVTIGDSSYPAGDDALFSEDVLLAWVKPTTDNWRVAQIPAQWSAGSSWRLQDSSGQGREIKIQRMNGSEISFRVLDPHDPNFTPMLIDAQESDGQLGLRSLMAQNRMNTLKISFEPALPLPASVPAANASQVQFTIDEDDQHGVALGSVTAHRGLGDEHLTWHFNSPNWARALTFDTGVNIIIGSEGLRNERTHAKM
jgi:hypothetical protein